MKIPPPHFAIEPLEARIAPATFTVINVADSGPGSFRQAILDANGNPGADTIAFAIPTLQLPVITPLSMLPAITDTVVIDALLSGGPKVTIDGTHAVGADGVNNGSGLMLYGKASSGSTIRGMVIYGFDIAGIEIQQSSSNTIVSNILGLSSSEGVTLHMPAGVLVSGGEFNKIGTAQEGNTIGGNDYGVRISGGSGASILSNKIGLSSGGARPNDIGILVENASNTTIGGSTAKNTISGNQTFGIKLSNAGGTHIEGNIIGLDLTGAKSAGNQEWGIFVDGGALNYIGSGAVSLGGKGNVITGNAAGGVWIKPGPGESSVTISGNLIGTTTNGASVPSFPGSQRAVGNGGPGIYVFQTSTSILNITTNLISGNAGAGIEIHNLGGNFVGSITGNLIGTDIRGTTSLGNGMGMLLDGLGGITVGGTQGKGNTIVSSEGDGLLIKNSTNVNVWGNYIGYAPNTKGANGFGNGGHGIHLQGVGTINIGTTGSSAIGNLVTLNGGDGVFYEGSAPNPRAWTPKININGNFIGTDGGNVQGNLGNGIRIADLPAIGTAQIGVGKTPPNVSRTGNGNLVSANAGDGIRIERADNVTLGANYIGTTEYGGEPAYSATLGNHGDGIALIDSSHAAIGLSYVSGIISGNLGNGISILGLTRQISDITIGGLIVGGVLDGNYFKGNQKDGILVDGTVSGIEIGVTRSGLQHTATPNIIGANGGDGIYFGPDVHDSLIKANRIGFASNGNPQSPLQIAQNLGDGIRIVGASNIAVGGDGSNNQNIVVSDTGAALRLVGASGTRVWGNDFTSRSGDTVIFESNTTNSDFGAGFAPNLVSGAGSALVIASGSNNRISSNSLSAANSGVSVLSGTGNEISQNHFTISEGGLFVDLGGDGVTPNDPLDADSGPNLLQNSPLLVSAALSGGQTLLRGEYRGAANVDVRIEWYVGGEFLTASDVHTDANGIAKLSLNLDQQFDVETTFSASATSDANTSEFSGSVAAAIPPQVIAKGALPGHAPRVRLLDASTHEVVMSTLAFGKNFRGGVSVSAADVDGDGYTDLVATSRTGAPVVKVFSGLDGHVISQFRVGNAGDSSVRSIAAGDLDGDGTVEVVIGRAKTMGGTVSVYDALNGTREAQFTPFGFNTPDTLRVSLQDIDGDQHPEVIVRASILSGIKQVALDPLSGQIEKVARALVS